MIAILAAIILVSHNGISNKAHVAALQQDLSTSATILGMAHAEDGVYPPQVNRIVSADANGGKPFDGSTGTMLSYNPSSDGASYCVQASNSAISYFITSSDQTPQTGTCSGSTGISGDGKVASIVCPTNYVTVPGNQQLGTSDFCLMKYEAKDVSGVATSQAAGTPWVSISQTSAITTAAAACAGCHLMTEAEWMTVAANVLGVPSNWSGGAVGSDYIYSGHNDSAPNNALTADTND